MKVILATDGSAHSLKAAELARWLAARDAAVRVIVLFVLPRPVTIDQAIASGVGLRYSGYEEEFARLGEKVLAETAAALELPAERVQQRVLIGVPAEKICELARAEEADLIVIGARGESMVKELLMGSTSHKVIQLAPCPVLVAR